MLVGIEIGGTKLQLGVGSAETGAMEVLEREAVRPADGAEGIRNQIRRIAGPWIDQYAVEAVGIGFGGPVDLAAGRTVKSYQVAGWDDFPLVDWCRQTFGRPAGVANDTDMAGLGESCFGAGRGRKVVFYTNVGSGIGGALVIDGRVYVGGAGFASELGHVSLNRDDNQPLRVVESQSSGWAIAAAARADDELAGELARQYHCRVDQLTARMVAEAAAAGNPAAGAIFRRATQVYGWAIAQTITLLSPEVVVVGGGVPLAGEALFFAPLREEIERCVFSPLRGTYRIVPAELGEEVVVHGALALARELAEHGNVKNLFIP